MSFVKVFITITILFLQACSPESSVGPSSGQDRNQGSEKNNNLTGNQANNDGKIVTNSMDNKKYEEITYKGSRFGSSVDEFISKNQGFVCKTDKKSPYQTECINRKTTFGGEAAQIKATFLEGKLYFVEANRSEVSYGEEKEAALVSSLSDKYGKPEEARVKSNTTGKKDDVKYIWRQGNLYVMVSYRTDDGPSSFADIIDRAKRSTAKTDNVKGPFSHVMGYSIDDVELIIADRLYFDREHELKAAFNKTKAKSDI